MSGFADDWLALREPADARSRNPALQSRLRDALAFKSSIRVIDLGAGTGSNFRHLAPILGSRQHWTLVDNDPLLLQRQAVRLAEWSLSRGAGLSQGADGMTIAAGDFDAHIDRRHVDLATRMATLAIDDADLITGSALLDLASDAWLAELAERTAAAGCIAYFTLSYDGRITWTPPHANDADIVSRVNAHQRQDKGFGLAAGPDAGVILAECFARHDFDVVTATSDWHLGIESGALQRKFDAGLARAAGEFDDAFADEASAWLAARRAMADDADATVTTVVGHVDVLALPR